MTDGTRRPLAVVTGASRGLGEVVARFLASAGYDLVLVARGEEALADAGASVRALGAQVATVAGDVSAASVRASVRAAVERQGPLELLVNNASELGPSSRPTLTHVPTADFERVFRVNVVAPVELIATLLPSLRAAKTPLVVNISSDAAVGAYPGWGAYGASKAALDLVSRTLATELAESHVSVVAVDPGDLRTAMHQAAFLGEDISDRPLPDVTVPFWAWLLGREPGEVNGRRFQAQADRWGAPP
ncbi:MAG: SDR family oxidoreductase [Thermoplasmata archaeon]|nr:SDR family oxidoreductase [Thermoplasmata archaeon]MCI4355798.1 SDR family oxidoreductase [Thermoplasmata archaeon]